MHAFSLLLAASLLGIDYGYQPIAGGGFEYIIQIEPEMLDVMRDGNDIVSDVPPSFRNVRRYRITVGDAPLPHEGETPPAESSGGTGEPPNADQPGSAPAEGTSASGPGGGSGVIPGPDRFPYVSPFDKMPGSISPTTSSDVSPNTTASEGPAEHSAETTASQRPVLTDTPLEEDVETNTESSEARPWPAFIMAMLGLFASVGVNAFLGWVVVDQRRRYRSLASRTTAAA